VTVLRPLLTVEQVAIWLGVSPRTVRRLPIPVVRVGTGRRKLVRYRHEAVERWLREHAAGAA